VKNRFITMLAVPILAGTALLGGCSHPQPVYGPPPPGIQIHDQGIHDGFEAARNDVANGRPPRFNAHPRYRNPPVPPPAWGDYRSGFRQGYEQFLHQGPPPGPGY
jgi:hypothetical protein